MQHGLLVIAAALVDVALAQHDVHVQVLVDGMLVARVRAACRDWVGPAGASPRSLRAHLCTIRRIEPRQCMHVCMYVCTIDAITSSACTLPTWLGLSAVARSELDVGELDRCRLQKLQRFLEAE